MSSVFLNHCLQMNYVNIEIKSYLFRSARSLSGPIRLKFVQIFFTGVHWLRIKCRFELKNSLLLLCFSFICIRGTKFINQVKRSNACAAYSQAQPRQTYVDCLAANYTPLVKSFGVFINHQAAAVNHHLPRNAHFRCPSLRDNSPSRLSSEANAP